MSNIRIPKRRKNTLLGVFFRLFNYIFYLFYHYSNKNKSIYRQCFFGNKKDFFCRDEILEG